MRYYKQTVKILIILMVILSTNIYAAQHSAIVVSSNIKIKELSKKELEKIFLGKTTILKDGTKVNIALSVQNSKEVKNFFTHYIGKSQRRFKKYWLKKVFAGYGVAPKIFKSNKAVLEYISKRENFIAFVTVDDKEALKDISIVPIDKKRYF